MSVLNTDVLTMILEELKDNKKALYKCLFINRLWCEIVARILWSNPRKFLSHGKELNFFKSVISHLPESSKQILDDGNIDVSSLMVREEPSFNYIEFCKCIDYSFISIIIKLYVAEFDILDDSQKKLLECEILKLLISKCSGIKYLRTGGVIHPICQFQGANICFPRINELNCDSNNNDSLFRGLAMLCKDIEIFTINLQNDNPALAELIEAQRQIKYLKIVQGLTDQMNAYPIFSGVIQDIHSSAITSVDLWIYDGFPVDLLSSLTNLRTLILYNNFVKDLEEQLTIAVFSNLQSLKLTRVSTPTITNIIRKNNNNLRKIIIAENNNYYHNRVNNSREYLKAICEQCPDVRYISIDLHNELFENEFKELLNTCHNLEGIEINIIDENFNGDKFLEIFVNSAPASLRKLLLMDLNIFETNSLKKFFKKWQRRKQILTLYESVMNDGSGPFNPNSLSRYNYIKYGVHGTFCQISLDDRFDD